MKSGRLLVCLFLGFSLLLPATAHQSPPQAMELLRKALSALGVTSPITDVTLSGTAHYTVGGDDETGTATLKAVAGASRIDLNLSSGSRSEIQNVVGAPVGSWSGPDGVSHAMALHNLLTDPAWFFPAFPIAHGISPGHLATFVATETRNGQTVEHLTISQVPAAQSSAGVSSMSHLSQMDFFLDSTTFLPAAVTFNIHPDNNALLDIPIEVRFSDYRSVSGAQIPFHIEKFLNNGLILDVQFQNVTLNSGLPATDFTLGASQ